MNMGAHPAAATPPARNTASSTKSQDNSIFARLRELRAACGRNVRKRDKTLVLIMACISEGVDTKARIIAVLAYLALDGRHVARVLDEQEGAHPSSSRWRRDTGGRYILHPKRPSLPVPVLP